MTAYILSSNPDFTTISPFAGDILAARKLIFPGVGAYASAMEVLKRKDLIAPVKEYVQSGRSFLGICLGLQLLFDGSEENDGVEGLGIIPGTVAKFDTGLGLPVPHIGWNGALSSAAFICLLFLAHLETMRRTQQTILGNCSLPS